MPGVEGCFASAVAIAGVAPMPALKRSAVDQRAREHDERRGADAPAQPPGQQQPRRAP